MDDITRWKVIANLLISMKTLIEGALGVIQEKIREIEPARGQQNADEESVLKRVQEASGRMGKTFGRTYPVPSSAEPAKGSEATPPEPQPQAGSNS